MSKIQSLHLRTSRLMCMCVYVCTVGGGHLTQIQYYNTVGLVKKIECIQCYTSTMSEQCILPGVERVQENNNVTAFALVFKR